jgi:hypothetical protein
MYLSGRSVILNKRGEQELASLVEFIRQNDSIVLSEKTISVAKENREEFYKRFDQVLESFITEEFQTELKDASVLAKRYKEVRDKLIASTNVGEISLPHSLETFLGSPKKAVAVALYDYLFTYLQGKMDEEELYSKLEKYAREHFERLQRCSFEPLIFMSVLLGLKPTKFWNVNFGLGFRPVVEDAFTLIPGNQRPVSEWRIPDTVMQTVSGKYFACKFESVSEIGYYDVAITRRRDNTLAGHSKEIVGQRAMMLYEIDSLDEVPILADRVEGKALPASLVVEVSTPEELDVAASRLALANRALTLNPSGGYYVIVPEGVDGNNAFKNDYDLISQKPPFIFLSLSFQKPDLSKLPDENDLKKGESYE